MKEDYVAVPSLGVVTARFLVSATASRPRRRQGEGCHWRRPDRDSRDRNYRDDVALDLARAALAAQGGDKFKTA